MAAGPSGAKTRFAPLPGRGGMRTTSERLEIFDQRLSIVRRQRRPDHALDFLVLVIVLPEFVASVRVAANGSVEFEAIGDRVGLVTELHGVVFAAAEIEFRRSFFRLPKQIIDGRHRS